MRINFLPIDRAIDLPSDVLPTPGGPERQRIGPLFVFLREAFAVGFGVYSGVYLAPRQKKVVFTFFIFLWILFLLLISFAIGLTFFRMEWTTEKLLRNLTEIVAQLIGIVIAGIFIWKEQKQIETHNYSDYELLDN